MLPVQAAFIFMRTAFRPRAAVWAERPLPRNAGLEERGSGRINVDGCATEEALQRVSRAQESMTLCTTIRA